MPGPIITAKPLPEWADPNKASESDPLYQTLLRKAVGWSGVNDPESAMMGIASPLVSIYKDKAAREAGGAIYKEMAEKLGPKVNEALLYFENRYPRVAAHLRPKAMSAAELGSDTARGVAVVPNGKVTKPITIGISPAGASKSLPDVVNTVFHEGTHGAQALGNSKSDRLYDLADELVLNHQNPLEANAIKKGYNVGQDFARKRGLDYNVPLDLMHTVKKPYKNAMQQMLDIATENPARAGTNGENIKKTIRDIVNQRLDKTVTPEPEESVISALAKRFGFK